MSWSTQVIADNSGQWVGDGLRFATVEEAEAYVYDLMMRWTLVSETAVVESDDPVNSRWVNGHAESLEPEPEPVIHKEPEQVEMFDDPHELKSW
jgi:hypothetical protein